MATARSLRMAARRAGLDICRANPWTVWEMRVRRFLEDRGVRTILDVGANDGGYASELFAAGWTGNIISYEPLPDAWSRLKEHAASRPGWTVAPQIALSDSEGEAPFHEAGNSYSSSLLAMTQTHVSAAPESATVRVMQVRTRRLDDVIDQAPPGPHFLKIDVQGAEKLVIEGATRSLASSIVGIQTEVSLATLYEGQETEQDLLLLLRGLGFKLWDIVPGFRDPNSLRLLQYDAILFRDR